MGLAEAESINFKYTTMNLNKVYDIGLKHALQNIQRAGGKVSGDNVSIAVQQPVPVKFEKSFDGHYPLAKMPVRWSANKDEVSFNFDGIGFVIKGDASKWGDTSDYVLQTELYVDDKLVEKPRMPVSFTTRKYDLAFKYGLPKGKHSVKLKILNPGKEHPLRVNEAIVYTDRPVNGTTVNEEAAKKKSF